MWNGGYIKMSSKNYTKEVMTTLADTIKEFLPGVGFVLLTFNADKPGKCNYISNADRKDMVKALFEAAYKLKEK